MFFAQLSIFVLIYFSEFLPLLSYNYFRTLFYKGEIWYLADIVQILIWVYALWKPNIVNILVFLLDLTIPTIEFVFHRRRFKGHDLYFFLANLRIYHHWELPILREKCPNTEFLLVCIFLYSDWIRRRSKSPDLVRIKENSDQKKLRIWTPFAQC